MDDYSKQKLGWENHFRNTSYLWEEPVLPKSKLSKEELDLKYGKYIHFLPSNKDLETRVAETFNEWRQTREEAVESELKSYLESVHNIDCKQIEQYIKTCNNVKLKGVDIHYVTSPTGSTDWYDAGVLIFTSGEELQGTVFNFTIKRFWRDV